LGGYGRNYAASQREIFTGLLLPFLSGTLSDTKPELEKMNAAIRNLAEQRTV